MTEDHGQERRLIAVTRTDPPTRVTHDVLGDDEDAPPARPDGPGDDFSPEDGGRDAQGLTEALEAAGDYADPADGIIDDVIVLAARRGWPYVRCGEPCGFTTTGPATLVEVYLADHHCGQPGDVPDVRGHGGRLHHVHRRTGDRRVDGSPAGRGAMMPTENWPKIPDSDQTDGQTNREAAERWLNLSTDPAARAQGHAVLAVLDCLDAVTAAVNATLPGILRGFGAIGEAVREARNVQVEALGRIADRLEEQVRALDLMAEALHPPQVVGEDTITPHMAIMWNDRGTFTLDLESRSVVGEDAITPREPDLLRAVDVPPPVEVDTLHAAERLRIKLDRVEELATKALHGDSFDRAVLARQVLDVLSPKTSEK